MSHSVPIKAQVTSLYQPLPDSVTKSPQINFRLGGYLAPVDLPFELPTRIYGCMLAIWQLRPYLQRRFPLHELRYLDYVRFLAWCVTAGRRDYAILRELDAWNQELQLPVTLPPLKNDRWAGTFSVAMYLMGITRSRYWLSPIQNSVQMRHRVARWFWRNGRHELSLTTLPNWQLQALKQQFETPCRFTRNILVLNDRKSRVALRGVRRRNADLYQGWTNTVQATDPERVIVTPRSPIAARFMATTTPNYLRQMTALRAELAKDPTADQIASVTARIKTDHKSPLQITATATFGVNLYGYAHGELGIGEDVRMVAKALTTAAVPVCIINIEPGGDVSQSNHGIDSLLTEHPRYSINLFCMTGIEQTRLLCEQGCHWFENRYTIGLWPWELPRWPTAWHHAWNSVQEIWGISQYTASAYGLAPVPVKPVPLPVCLGVVGEKTRSDFNLPSQSYLFVFAFDLNSSLARKNPQAVVRAFQLAFPKVGTQEVGMVIKINHPNDKDREWKALKRQMKKDKRIHLLEGSFRKQDVTALLKSCDCFISLHRAEGFGRAIAEAQLLEMPVITTGFSGNIDFCTSASTQLVDFQLRDMAAGEYFYAAGQHWAEPDITHAARQMQLALLNRNTSPQHTTTQFKPEQCGQVYKQHLEQIHARITGKEHLTC